MIFLQRGEDGCNNAGPRNSRQRTRAIGYIHGIIDHFQKYINEETVCLKYNDLNFF